MSKNKKTLIVLLMLVMVIIYVWYPILTNRGGGTSPEIKLLAHKNISSRRVAEKTTKTYLDNHADVPIGWGRNPFVDQFAVKHNSDQKNDKTLVTNSKKEIVAPTDPTLSLTLNGIFWDKNKPSVLIDNNVYGLGDVVNGLQITAITSTEVIFSFNDQEYTMTLKR